ncbi:MAG TPA: tetratricopeptide repeat protein, partial [Gemmatimonadales bacterium]|nr:tetratricopeptide repeat protein [Gemmatimonadales bacterium]
AEYGDTHPVVLLHMMSLAEARQHAADFKGGEAQYREALVLARRLMGDEHTTTASIKVELGEALGDLRRYEEADSMIAAGLATRLRLLGENHADVALARTQLARLRQDQGRFEEADSLFRLSLESRRKLLGDSVPAVASSLDDIGYNFQLQGRWADAEPYHRGSLRIFQAHRLDREATESMAHLGWVLSKEAKLAEADSLLTESLRRRIREYGPDHPNVGDAIEKLAGLAVARKYIARAESLTVRGLEIRRKVYGPRSPSISVQLLNLAFMHELRNDSAGAIPILQEALDITSSVRPPTDASVILNQQWLATEQCTVGDAREGEALLRTAMANAGSDSTRSMPWRIRILLGYCLARQQRFAEAEPLMLEGYQRLAAVPNVPPQITGAMLNRMAQLYQLWGKPEREQEWRAKAK